MNFEIKKYDRIYSLQFPDLKKELVDIDCLFKATNNDFYIILQNLGLEIDFDFKKTHNKRLYAHSFIKTITNFLKNKTDGFRPYFYSNLLTKDTFRNNLIKKVKRIFGFSIWEDIYNFDVISDNLHNCDINCKIEGLFSAEKRPKKFQQIRKNLIKEGLTELNDSYFQDLRSKMQIYL